MTSEGEQTQLYEKVIEIRAFEETVLELFTQNRLSGTTHTYIGQEATAVAVMQYVTEADYVFSNHRCHGHYLAYGGSAKRLLAEIMSRKSGLCEGRGGSQHIHYKNFFTNGVQGGIVPNALGLAFAKKIDDSDANVVVFLGDGTLGEGVIYESLNISAIYQVPILYVVEDNGYAMTTPSSFSVAGSIRDRFGGFGIKTFEITSTDVDELNTFFEDVFHCLNSTRRPVCAIVHNYRLGAHSKGDDIRDVNEISAHKKDDPIRIVANRLGTPKADALHSKYLATFMEYADELAEEQTITVSAYSVSSYAEQNVSYLCTEPKRCVTFLQQAFFKALVEYKDIVFYGEDIRDPYGGAFKATKGLSTEFPDSVYNMPISEAGMVGMAVGMAMANKIPVVEMMFGDFITLGLDQLINHAAKYAWVYGSGVTVPMIVRVPSGGKRGYGPTHSQSLEKFLIGIPQIKVLALSAFHNPQMVYEVLFRSIKEPTVVIENKKLYAERIEVVRGRKYGDFYVREINHTGYSTLLFTIDEKEKADVTIITYGGMAKEAVAAADKLMIEDEIMVNVIVLSQLSPLPVADLKELLADDSWIVTVEEGTLTGGVGAEIAAKCSESRLCSRASRIAAPDIPIPNGVELEKQVIPDENTIYSKVRELINEN